VPLHLAVGDRPQVAADVHQVASAVGIRKGVKTPDIAVVAVGTSVRPSSETRLPVRRDPAQPRRRSSTVRPAPPIKA